MANTNAATQCSSLILKGTTVLNVKQQDLWVKAQSKSVLINLPSRVIQAFFCLTPVPAELLGFKSPWYFQ